MTINKLGAQLLHGTIRNLKLENTTAEVFFRANDREGMAATGVLAAAVGLSGMAAGMTAMSMEEMSEPVTKASFDLDGKHVDALLWNWPFKEGDEVQVVAEMKGDGNYTGFAVLDPNERIIVLYPHVSAGGRAHWNNVIKISAISSLLFGAFMVASVILLYFFKDDVDPEAIIIVGGGAMAGISILFSWVGYRIGRRFTHFTRMAESIFSILGWDKVSRINLRRITKAKLKPDDPPAMGDSYFRY